MSNEKSKIDLTRTILTFENDGTIKESYYVPCLDDNSDQEEAGQHRVATKGSKTRAANQPTIFLDLSFDEEEAATPINQIRQGVEAIDISDNSDGMPSFFLSFILFYLIFIVESRNREEEEDDSSTEMNVDFEEAVRHDIGLLRDECRKSRHQITHTDENIAHLQVQVDQQQRHMTTLEQQIALLQQQMIGVLQQQQQQPQPQPDHELEDEAQPRQYKIAVSGQFAKQHRDLGRLIESKDGFTYLDTVTQNCSFLILSDLALKNQKVAHAALYHVPLRSGQFLAELLGVNVDEIVLNQ